MTMSIASLRPRRRRRSASKKAATPSDNAQEVFRAFLKVLERTHQRAIAGLAHERGAREKGTP